MDADRNSRPPSSRFADGPLASQERQAIADVLSAEKARRRKVIPRELTFFVDAVEHARVNLEESRELRFQASAGAQLLEIWTEDERGPLLLATHIMTHAAHLEKEVALVVKGERSVSVSLTRTADETTPWKVFVSVEDIRRTAIASSIKNWLVCPPPFPAFPGIAVLLIAVLLLSTGLWHTLEKERARNRVLDAELAGERAAQTSLHHAEVRTIAKYRLTPDDLIIRGNGDIQENPVVVPSLPTVIELVLPVTEMHGGYRFVLTPLNAGNRILVEEGLSADARGAETAVICPVPSDLLA
jgi:hypothetical protein